MTAVAAVVRARGLSAHLASEAHLADLERARDLPAICERLVAVGYPADVLEPATAPAVDRAGALRLAGDLAVLARWSSGRDALAVVAADLDRRSVRDLVRGLAGRAPADRRIAAAVPTPALPDAALRELAASANASELAAALARRGHPYAPAVAAVAGDAVIDLLAVELALAHRFAGLARDARGARRDRALAAFVDQTIDLENLGAALVLAERRGDLDLATSFVPGGRRLAADAAVAVARATGRDARARLARAFARTPVAEAVHAPDPHAVERAGLDWQIATQEELRRRDPLSSAAIVWLLLRRRAELVRVRRAAWRVALGGAA